MDWDYPVNQNVKATSLKEKMMIIGQKEELLFPCKHEISITLALIINLEV